MKANQTLAGFSLAACLFFASMLSPAQAQKFAGKSSSLAPSLIGGAPINVAVYNYLPNPATAYFVDPNGKLQVVPGVGPIPPMSGSTPAIVPSFRGATLVFKGPKGAGNGKRFTGKNPAPFIVLGTPPPGAALPPGSKGATPAGPGGPTPSATPTGPSTVVNKSVVNKSVVNNNAPAAAAPGTPATGKKRGAKAPDINVTINTPPSDAPAAPSPDAPAPAGPSATAPVKDDSGEEFVVLSAEDPRVVEFLRIHNAARADVGVGPLTWSDDLAFTAQDWADHLGRTGKILHRAKSEYGENIGWGTGVYTAASAANSWLAEKAKYSPDAKPEIPAKKKGKAAASADETGHYTQMVWGKSTMVGFGIATTKDGKTVVVANYNPRGNMEGEKPY